MSRAAFGALLRFTLIGSLLAGCGSPPCPAPCEEPELPAELAKPGRRLWQGERESWRVLDARGLGELTQILQPPLADEPDGRLLLVGTRAALRAVAPPARRRWTRFEDPGDDTVAWEVRALDLDGDGRLEFVNRGGNWHPATVWDADGRIRWRLDWGVNQLATGRLDDDEHVDFVVGRNARGLARLDGDGETVWEHPGGNVWDVELTDLDGDGRDEILHSGPSRRFFVRDAGGAVLSEVDMDPAVSHFALTHWGLPGAHPRIAYLYRDRLWLVRPDGSARRSLDLGVPSNMGRPSLAPLRLEGRAAPGLALLVDFRVHERALLNLYDDEGSLFYQEVLPTSCSSLAVDPRDPTGEVLLLGCTGELLANGPSLAVYRRSLAVNEALQGPRSPNLVPDLGAIAWRLLHLDRSAEGLPYALRALAIAEAAGDDAHPLAESLNTLAMLEIALGRREQAAEHLARALDLVDPVHPEGPRLESDIHYNLGRLHFDQRQLDRAEAHYRRALTGSAYPADLAKAAHDLARVYLEQERFEEGERMIRIAIEKDREAYPPGHVEVKRDLALYARILRSAGRAAEAEQVEMGLRETPPPSRKDEPAPGSAQSSPGDASSSAT